MDNNTHISKLWNVLPNKLSGMPAPEVEDLKNLYNNGVRSIVCLLEDGSNIESYNKNGFESLWLPVADEEEQEL